MVSKGRRPLAEVQEAAPPGGFQGKALTFRMPNAHRRAAQLHV